VTERLSAFELRRLWLGLGFAACGVLFYLCLIPHPPTPDISQADKVEHFLAYTILGAWFGGVLARRYWIVFIGLVIFGALIEVVQAMTTYRSGDPYDLLADTLGVVAGIGLARLGAMRWLRYIDRRVAAKRNSAG